MSNILFVGPVSLADGWGQAAREYVRALRTTCHNVKVKPVFLGGPPMRLEDMQINELMYGEYDHYDAVIQNCMPHLFKYDKRFGKNIGLFPVETSGWENNWPATIRLMDEIWTTSEYSRSCILNSAKNCPPVYVIEIPTDLQKYKKEYPKIPSSFIPKKNFVFYFIGEDIERKNLDLLIRAFHCEFDKSEKVSLVIKTNRNGIDSETLRQHLAERISAIKNTLSIYGSEEDYHNEIVITERLNEEQVLGIHQSCDCFVMPSSGEGWSIPAIDAAGFGNWVVMSDTGCYNWADLIVRTRPTRVFTKDKPLADLFASCETWLEVNQINLQNCMREAFESKAATLAKRSVAELSYQLIGEKMCLRL